MPSAIDRWLKGVDEQLRGVDTSEIDERIAALNRDIDVARLKIGILRQLRETARASGPEPVAAKPAARSKPSASTTKVRARRAPTGKRRMILEVMKERPGRPWPPRRVQKVLESRGLIEEDAGTPTRLLMRRMAESGDIVKLDQGLYAYAPDDAK